MEKIEPSTPLAWLQSHERCRNRYSHEHTLYFCVETVSKLRLSYGKDDGEKTGCFKDRDTL